MSLQHWESYYRGGALSSCPLDCGGSYTQELRSVWVEFFSGLAEGARILDIGTGNGAIALIARETAAAAGRRYEIHGTDLARIDPPRDVKGGDRLFAGIRFHAQVATEELPFEASAFDAISGQYALEYADIGRALAEIRRVVRPGGNALFILHHAESILARNAGRTLQQSALVLDETQLLRRLRRFLEAERRSPAAARKSWPDLVTGLRDLELAAGRTDDPHVLSVTIDAVQKILAARRRLSPAATAQEVDRFEESIRAAARRLRDLIRCGQTEDGMRAIAGNALALGLTCRELAPQYHAGVNLVGWRLRLAKP